MLRCGQPAAKREKDNFIHTADHFGRSYSARTSSNVEFNALEREERFRAVISRMESQRIANYATPANSALDRLVQLG